MTASPAVVPTAIMKEMQPAPDMFDRSVMRQIEVNQARSPSERFLALCDLLDAVRDMAPRDEAARERRRRALAVRHQERERWREQCRQFIAAQRAGTPTGL
jgi:hypothetical protein